MQLLHQIMSSLKLSLFFQDTEHRSHGEHGKKIICRLNSLEDNFLKHCYFNSEIPVQKIKFHQYDEIFHKQEQIKERDLKR